MEGVYHIRMTIYRWEAGHVITEAITKPLTIVNREGGAAYLGNFKGSTSLQPQDSFTIQIFRILDDLPSYPKNTHVLSNLPKGCLSQLPTNPMNPLTTLSFGYRMFVTDAPRCFPGTTCIGNFQSGKLIIDFATIDTSQPFDPTSGTYPSKAVRFIGYRL
ncbi:MAG: hypothetical protein ACJ75B_07450 [Flavisolibacter sp.]